MLRSGSDAALPKLTLPAGINHHLTKNLLASRNARKLYVTLSSTATRARAGWGRMTAAPRDWEVDVARAPSVCTRADCATRTGVGPATLWAVVNDRDKLGSNLDYLTSDQ